MKVTPYCKMNKKGYKNKRIESIEKITDPIL